jgi:hypothetical protein
MKRAYGTVRWIKQRVEMLKRSMSLQTCIKKSIPKSGINMLKSGILKPQRKDIIPAQYELGLLYLKGSRAYLKIARRDWSG